MQAAAGLPLRWRHCLLLLAGLLTTMIKINNMKKNIDNDYPTIPMHEIEAEARLIAVRWVDNHEPDGSVMQIEAKHKLASDIMNYARRFSEGKIKPINKNGK